MGISVSDHNNMSLIATVIVLLLNQEDYILKLNNILTIHFINAVRPTTQR